MQNQNGVPFRDGFPYHQNLDAVRSVFDAQEEEFWTEHLYGRWVHGLRSLSEPVPLSAPDTFQTRAWKRRILNTQLGSWTQLRHDTMLYVKQSFTPPLLCEFPDGYVDPYPKLWQRLSDIALAYQGFIETFDYDGMIGLERKIVFADGYPPVPTQYYTPTQGFRPELNDLFPDIFRERITQVDRGQRLSYMKEHLTNFSERCLTLKSISEQQLRGEPHTDEMKLFIENTVQDFSIIGYDVVRLYNGWFPNLYFKGLRLQEWAEHPSSLWKPVVVDVHTDALDPVCAGDPGAILNEGIGRVKFMLTAVKHADGTSCVYGGPVMSHYEFTTPLGIRLSNDDWKSKFYNQSEPPFNPWKYDYMAPKEDE